jgi:transcription antitermination protein nusG
MILTKPKSVNAGPSSGTGEGVAHSKRWYVALVRMHHEKKVAERLSKMGIDSFVPVQHKFINGVTVVRWLIQSYSQ